jgi:ABC-type glutathione transport system ATPase component
VAAIGLHFFLGLAIVILIEIGAFRWLVVLANSQEKKVKQEINLKPDEDVVEEEKRVEKLQPVDCLVRVNKLRKVYTSLHENPVVAVEGTSFSVEKGDCFALLGVNGCGKTTTFKSLT